MPFLDSFVQLHWLHTAAHCSAGYHSPAQPSGFLLLQLCRLFPDQGWLVLGIIPDLYYLDYPALDGLLQMAVVKALCSHWFF